MPATLVRRRSALLTAVTPRLELIVQEAAAAAG